MAQHIAASGLHKGKWVECKAQTQCRIGGVHISDQTLKYAKEYIVDTGILPKNGNPTVEQVEMFNALFGSKPYQYHFSKKVLPENQDEVAITFNESYQKEAFRGRIQLTMSRRAYWDDLAKLAKKGDTDILIKLSYFTGGSTTLSGDKLEKFLNAAKTNKHERMEDVSGITVTGDREIISKLRPDIERVIRGY